MVRTATNRLKTLNKKSLNKKINKRPQPIELIEDFDDLDIPAGNINRIKMQIKHEVSLCR